VEYRVLFNTIAPPVVSAASVTSNRMTGSYHSSNSCSLPMTSGTFVLTKK
jgi:hypothetical protein